MFVVLASVIHSGGTRWVLDVAGQVCRTSCPKHPCVFFFLSRLSKSQRRVQSHVLAELEKRLIQTSRGCSEDNAAGVALPR